MNDSSFKSNIWKAYLVFFLSNISLIGGVLVPFFTEWGGISFKQILFLQSWFMFWAFLLEVPTGAIADYFGRKYSLILAVFFNAIGFIVYSSVPNFYIFLLAEFIIAMAVALASGAGEAFVYDSLKKIGETEKSKKVFGRIETFKLIGIMIGSPLGSIIAAKFGLRFPVMLMSIPLLTATIIALTFKEPKTTEKIESKRYIKILKDGVKFFHDNKILKILAFDMISISVIAYFMVWLFQPMLQQSGVNIVYYGLIHASFVISQILIINNYSFLEKVLGSKRRLIFFSSLITGVMFIIGGLTTSIPLVLMAIIVGGGFGLAREPLFESYMNKQIPSPERATIISTISMFRRFALTIINPLVGMLVDWSLNYTLIILGSFAVMFSFLSRVKEEHLID